MQRILSLLWQLLSVEEFWVPINKTNLFEISCKGFFKGKMIPFLLVQSSLSLVFFSSISSCSPKWTFGCQLQPECRMTPKARGHLPKICDKYPLAIQLHRLKSYCVARSRPLTFLAVSDTILCGNQFLGKYITHWNKLKSTNFKCTLCRFFGFSPNSFKLYI